MSATGFKLDPGHRDGCWFTGDAQQFIVTDGTEHRAENGRKGGSTSWQRFLCNDPECPAVALVRWDVLSDFVSAGLL